MGRQRAAPVGLVFGALAFPEERVAFLSAGFDQAAIDLVGKARIVEADGEVFRTVFGRFLPCSANFGREAFRLLEYAVIRGVVAFLLVGVEGDVRLQCQRLKRSAEFVSFFLEYADSSLSRFTSSRTKCLC
jgi:hypothetical protein